MKVVYGHTDSIYVEMPIEKTKEVLDLLNNHVRQKFPNVMELEDHPVTLEFEKYFQSLGVGITKNRNAGLISWKDGEFLDKPEFVMTGFTAKRISITPLAKKIQSDILVMWVEQKPEEEITQFLKSKYNSVLNGDIDLKEMVNRSRLREDRLNYKCSSCAKKYTWIDALSARKKNISYTFCLGCGNDLMLLTIEGKTPSIGSGIEGVLWYNQNRGMIEDSYIYMKVADDTNRVKYTNPVTGISKRPSYISTNNMEEMLEFTPDYAHYANSILKKADPIYRAMGWDIDPIRRDINQRTLDEWF